MTLSMQLTKRIYAGNGLTREWDVDFPLVSAEDLHVFVTSPSGAVIHDITETLNRRNPHYHLIIYPAAVQGATCPEEVCAGL
ncbi:MAG: hypothetical protein IKO35_01195, partial [Elusimicrobiaceae bacterium]|nr:hypothetical protein [Elusimicrobiaceae bacterium]